MVNGMNSIAEIKPDKDATDQLMQEEQEQNMQVNIKIKYCMPLS